MGYGIAERRVISDRSSSFSHESSRRFIFH